MVQCYLGACHGAGKGAAHDWAAALCAWKLASADAGNADPRHNLALAMHNPARGDGHATDQGVADAAIASWPSPWYYIDVHAGSCWGKMQHGRTPCLGLGRFQGDTLAFLADPGNIKNYI